MFFKRSFSQRRIDKHLAGFRTLDGPPRSSTKAIEEKLRASGRVEVRDFEIDGDRFDQYRESVNYENRFPRYFEEFGAEGVWIRKQLEHFISFEVTFSEPGKVFIDVAAGASPVADIAKQDFGVAVAYKQDMNYPKKVEGERIISNACAIPLDDGSVDAVLAHNSWEHFEGDSDRGFLVEACRLLKPGGILCLIPLELRDEAFQVTSPSIWHTKYRNAPKLPQFDSRAAVVVDDSIKQRLVKYHSPETFLEEIEGLGELAFTCWSISNGGDYRFQQHFLTAEKRVWFDLAEFLIE